MTHAQSVVLKGALSLKAIGILGARPTMDIDMLRKGKADQASLVALVKDCAIFDVEPDGLTYIAESAVAEEVFSKIRPAPQDEVELAVSASTPANTSS